MPPQHLGDQDFGEKLTNGSGYTGGDPLEPLRSDLAELFRLTEQYAKVQKDLVQARLRAALIKGATLAVAALLGTVALIVATVLLIRGLSYAIADLFDSAPWVGDLSTGVGILLLTAIGATIALRKRRIAARDRALRTTS